MKELPRRWFDWRRRRWRVPADVRLAKPVEALLGRFPELQADPEVLAWLDDSGRWRAVVSVVAYEGSGAFILRSLSGDPRPSSSATVVARTGGCPSGATRREMLPASSSSTTWPASAPARSRRAVSRRRRSSASR